MKTIIINYSDFNNNFSNCSTINLEGVNYQKNTEYFVEISAKTKDAWGVLPKGFEVAHEQIKLKSKYVIEAIATNNGSTLKLKKSDDIITVSNEIVKVVFSKKEGRLISYIFKGKELLKDGKGPKPNFWRAVTDNDAGNKMYSRNIEWKKASLFSKVTNLSTNITAENLIELKVTYALPGVDTQFHSVYKINGNGVVQVANVLEKTSYKADIPRIGMRMQLPKKYDNMTYFGRGPWGNYQDRKASAFVDLYESKVKDQYHAYVRPQENGYKTDVRWVALSDDNGNGLLVVSGNHKTNLGVSALHMPNEDFDTSEGLDYGDAAKVALEYRIDGIPAINESKHINDIKEKDLVQLNIDLVQRGVAGNNSWGAMPEEKYLIKGNIEHTYSYFLIPFEKGEKELFIETSKQFIEK